MSILDIHDPAVTLAELIARVRRGEVITIADEGMPLAKVLPMGKPSISRDQILGIWKDAVHISDDFNAPLSEEELREWEK